LEVSEKIIGGAAVVKFQKKCKTGYISTSLASWGSSLVSKEAESIKKFDFLGFSRCFSVRIEQTSKKYLKMAQFG